MPAPIPIGTLTAVSVALTAIVAGNAYYQKKQFYPSVVYITKSNTSMAAIYFLAFTVVILFGKLLKKVFFGQLRTAEFEQLIERSFYAITETCLAFTVFRDDFSPKFVALFTVLLFLKAFHYLTDSRVDFMERSPVITMVFHLRVGSLLMFLMTLDLLLLYYSYQTTVLHGATVQLVFGFEYAILMTVGLNVAVKYLCHSIDLRLENPWENKAVYLLYTELVIGLVKVILYSTFLVIMIRIYTFPLFIVRPMYLTMRSFKNVLNDVVQSRRAIHNMNTLYPEATAEELAAVDNVCIICREEMLSGAKKLPCGHIFHPSCLRSWFQRQQTCPTCRMDILRQTMPSSFQPRPPAAANQQPPVVNPQNQEQARPNVQNGNPFAALFGAAQGQVPPQAPPYPFAPLQLNNLHQQFQQAQAAQQPQQPTNTTPSQVHQQSGDASQNINPPTSSSSATDSSNQSIPRTFPFNSNSFSPLFSTMPPFMPVALPFPTPPPQFEGLTLEELQNMEGRERKHVEARIKALRNINILLDAAAFQLSQYQSVAPNVTTATQSTSSESENPTIKKEESADAEIKGESETAAASASVSESEACELEGAVAADPEESYSNKSSSFNNSEPDEESTQEIRRRRLEKIYGKENAETQLKQVDKS